jgi:glutamate/tyrosine decarboxylase-like PLP-dependent enzyme
MTERGDPWSILADVAMRSQAYLRTIGERRVSPSPEALDGLKHFDIPLPDLGCETAEIVEELDRFAAPATVANAGRRYFGFVNGGALPAAVAANWMATAWDQHGSFNVGSPESSAIERTALRWVVDLLGLPPQSQGGFSTGTTTAHIACLAAARSSLLSQVGWDAEADGLFGAPPVTVVVGSEVHSTMLKALGVVGLGRRRTVTVPADSQGRMRTEALPALTGPTILCLQAGNVNSGSFDPFRDTIGKARASGVPLWVHIDGAFGLWARVVPARAHLVDGVELADSWATDGHKWLNAPYDCGMAIVRDGAALRRALSINADYLPSAVENPMDYTLEASRRARGLDVWALLRSLGRAGLAEMVERHCQLAKRFADGFVDAGFTVLNDVVLNQVMVSFGDAERTRRVIAAVQEDGTCWCGPTVWQGHTAMRVSVINWATTMDDVDRSLAAILRIAKSA